ncbi:hypothetical protein AQUCO_02100189v1 [Aquilegia coerulea]|uniref:CSD domain-containing protein n=1 Tax=Aquilegia coerulea TaxID=218851 RepID=A0A2G5DF59_AQUCA|nr:hypothetical protein AQUCO_02100189v1 [Aquilegia coerulea]
MALSNEIVYISSDEEDDDLKVRKKQKKRKRPSSSSYSTVKKDDCFILEGDPDKPVEVVKYDTENGSEELVIFAEKGQIACRDYPHPRHLCASFPFISSPHDKHCGLCHCYVCDTQAPCVYWGNGMSSSDHCHSTDKEEKWRKQRCSKQEKLASLPESNKHKTTFSNVPPKHPAITRSQPLNCDSNTLPYQAIMQASRLTGVVKWINTKKSYGSIAPDRGGDTLFFNRFSLASKDYQSSLAKGDVVEFEIKIGVCGIKMAVNIRCLESSFPRSTIRRANDCSYIVGREGRSDGWNEYGSSAYASDRHGTGYSVPNYSHTGSGTSGDGCQTY